MRLEEAYAQLNLVQDLIPVRNSNRPGYRLVPTLITIHNTGNASKGANAARHARYVKGADAQEKKKSWHFTVDDKSVYQSLPTNEVGWHAGSGRGNASSLGVEICMHPEMDVKAAYDRAALLVAVLAYQNGISVDDGIVQHHDWAGKNCPTVLRSIRNGWKNFLSDVRKKYTEISAAGNGADDAAAALGFGHAGDCAALEATEGGTDNAASAGSAAPAPTLAGRAKPVPKTRPVPFALSDSPHATRHWPIVTSHPNALVVSYEGTDGQIYGRAERRFLADRTTSTGAARYHVGVDLYGTAGDLVVACEDGTIVNFYDFYKGTCALLVDHGTFVANYGEVQEASPRVFGWKIGDKVTAGQPIARVGGLNMLHFETYVPGTNVNSRWLKGSARPASLLNPTEYLLDLADNGLQLDPSGVVVAAASPRPANGAVALADATVPGPGRGEWHRRFGGREWRYDHRGVYTRNSDGAENLWRTSGEPSTCRKIYALYGDAILRASRKHGVTPALIMMTIATETHFASGDDFTGPRTFRWEAKVRNKDVTPNFLGSYSAGPMQCLATTVRDLLVRYGEEYSLPYDRWKVAPAFKKSPNPKPEEHPLYDGDTNLDIGTAVIRMLSDKTGDDPILVAAAYNAGDIYEDEQSSWGMRATGDHLDRAARWYGDACQVLEEMGIY